MVLLSRIHGKIEYEKDDIIRFEKGMLGLEELKQYLLVKLDEYDPFYLLQSIDDEDIGFILACPFDFHNEYEFDLKEDLIERLDIKKQEDVTIFTTVTLNSNVSKITTNLKAPIIINIYNKLGEQIILDKEKYQIKHPLMRE